MHAWSACVRLSKGFRIKIAMNIFCRLYYFYLSKKQPIKYARKLGVYVGEKCKLIDIGGRTFGSEPYLISIGNHVELAAEVTFITHDGGAWILRHEFPDLDVFGKIEIGNNVFIGRRVTILPGTKIGDNTVIGAGALVKGKLDPNSVYAGVPARKIRTLDEYCLRMRTESLDTKRMPLEDKIKVIKNHFNL